MKIISGTAAALGAVALLAALGPQPAAACACGCGVFDVGTGSMFPADSGGMLFVESDYMNQNRNWSGAAAAAAEANPDRRIRTHFMSLGAQYMLNRSWGLMVEVPYWQRDFVTSDALGAAVGYTHGALGDIRVKGVYTGFSQDMSTGLSFGVKLPSGDSTYAHFDPDTEIGTGSTDLLLGAYHLGKLSSDGRYSYFAQLQGDQPARSRAVYRPGSELVAVVGGYYEGWTVGGLRIAPVAHLTAAWRGHDGGLLGHPADSGYLRLLAAPGLELDAGRTRLYLDAAFSLRDHVSGNQLIARQLYKLSLGYSF